MNEFKKYYRLFLSNMLKQKKYTVTFKDNTEIIGIPTCGSFQTLNDSAEFSIKIEGGEHKIKKPLSSIKKVEKFVV